LHTTFTTEIGGGVGCNALECWEVKGGAGGGGGGGRERDKHA